MRIAIKSTTILNLVYILIFSGTDAFADDWRFADVQTESDIVSLSFSDKSFGWAVTSQGEILRTTDGGRTWILQTAYDGGRFTAVSAVDSNHAWVTDIESVWKTTDGDNWTLVTDTLAGTHAALKFVNLNTGLVGSNISHYDTVSNELQILPFIWWTFDGGVTWDSTMIPAVGFIKNVYHVSDTIIFASGDGWYARTSDYGQTWFIASIGALVAELELKLWPEIWLIPDSGMILYSLDGGGTWSAVPSPIDMKISAADFSCFGIVIGEDGKIAISVDGGTTWRHEYASTNHMLFDVVQIGCGEYWIAGAGGSLITNNVPDPANFIDSLSFSVGDEWIYEVRDTLIEYDINFTPLDTMLIRGHAIWRIEGYDTLRGKNLLRWEIAQYEDSNSYTSTLWLENSERGLNEIAYRNPEAMGPLFRDTGSALNNKFKKFELYDEVNKILGRTEVSDSIIFRDPPRTILTYPVNLHNKWVHFSDSFLSFRKVSEISTVETNVGSFLAAAVKSTYPEFADLDEINFIDWYHDSGMVKRDISILLRRFGPAGELIGYIYFSQILTLSDSSIIGIIDEPDGEKVTAGEFSLSQNYPNPFNPLTNIRYSLLVRSEVSLVIYDLRGQEVTRLIDGEERAAGVHSAVWDASTAASGLYFYRLTAGDFFRTRKMVLLK